MKVLCDACHRLLPPASWAVVDGALHVRCAGCGEAVVLPAAGERTPGETPAVSVAGTPGEPPAVAAAPAVRETAPVAGAETAGESPPPAVARAGEGPPAGPERETPTRDRPEGSSWLDGEWTSLESRWDDPDAHRRLLDRAAALDDLAALGRRYKERLDAHPGDAMAARARDELLKRATARLLVAPSRPAASRVSGKNVLVAAALLTLAGLLVLWLLQPGGIAGAP